MAKRGNARRAPQGIARGSVRIIAGEWRGRRLVVAAGTAVRPTPDRVRETLFNWLQFEIAGKRCLDLFAGSGALGIEALSRGAARVVFVERDPAAAASIRAALERLGSGRGQLVRSDALAFVASEAAEAFDVVFLDPPYAQRCLAQACAALEAHGWLAPSAWVYLEDAAAHGTPAVPATWRLLRSKKAGDVGYHRARRGAPTADQKRAERGSA